MPASPGKRRRAALDAWTLGHGSTSVSVSAETDGAPSAAPRDGSAEAQGAPSVTGRRTDHEGRRRRAPGGGRLRRNVAVPSIGRGRATWEDLPVTGEELASLVRERGALYADDELAAVEATKTESVRDRDKWAEE